MAHDVPWPGLRADWISNSDVGARHGAALLLTVPPGAGYPVHSHDAAERVVYVVSGEGTHRGDAGSQALTADDALVLPPGSWHGFENSGPQDARVLILYTPATEFPAGDYRVASADQQFGDALIRHRLHEVPGRPDISVPENGFDGFQVNWDGAAGSKETVLGFARFPQGSTHRWHRHTKADEGCIFLEGTAFHRFADPGGPDEETRAEPGVTLWIPENQWHTLVTDPDCAMCDCVWWYLGGKALEETGYELREHVEAQA